MESLAISVRDPRARRVTLPSAEKLCEGLVGRPVRTYLGLEVRIEHIEDGVALIMDWHGHELARAPLADVQAGLDRLDTAGDVPVTIGALGPSATYVAALLVEVEGAFFDEATARVVLAPT